MLQQNRASGERRKGKLFIKNQDKDVPAAKIISVV